MADWYGFNRSNYFKVKDEIKFKEFLEKWSAELWDSKDPKTGETLFGFTSCDDKGYLPNYREEDGKEYDFDGFIKELATHLADGEVAIMMEAGAEKLRYITGFAFAINSKGKSVRITLDDIYADAKKLGKIRTKCEY